MRDALVVRSAESIGNLPRDAQSLIERHWSRGRLALDELHHQVIRADVVNLADVGVIQRGDGFGFTFKAFRELRGGDLDRDITIQTGSLARYTSPMPPLPM